MKLFKSIGLFATLIVLVLACTTSAFAASNYCSDKLILRTQGHIPDSVSHELVPSDANLLPSDFPNGIIGDTDDRNVIGDTTVAPYLSIAALKVTYPSGISYGTGFMVSKNCMVTAGHNLIGASEKVRGEAAQSIVIFFGIYKSNGKLYCVHKKTVDPSTALFYHNPNYTGNSGQAEYDYGFIKFNSDLEWDVGWWGLNAENTSNLVGKNITVTGYQDYVMKTHSGNVMSLYGNNGTNAMFRHSADTAKGQSGSPVYLTENNTVVGIHTYGFASPNIYNGAWRITPEFIQLLIKNNCLTL